MLLDWTTVAFQVVNFLALVALLRYFLYDRVLEAMEARKRRVKARWEEAERREAEAREAEEKFRARQHELAEEREEILAAARVEAEERRETLLAEAEAEVEKLREAGARQVATEGRRLVQELRVRLGAQLHVLTRRVLVDLADEDLERRVMRVFLGQLEGFLERHPAEVAALTDEHTVLKVRSTFELDEEARGEVEGSLQERLGVVPKIQYEVDPGLICGLEFRAGGRALGWNVDSYLGELADELRDLLPAAGEEVADEAEPAAEAHG
jgi:F-type H+-transporting ATPase subunit b